VYVVNRTAKFVSAIAASVLAGALLTSMPCSAAGAPDDCLSAPTGAAPQGQHWYYRIDRATKRQCWYVREQADKTSQSAAPKASASARAPVRQPEATVVADAHAEWPAAQTRNPPDVTASIPASTPAQALSTPANPTRSQGGQITPQVSTPQAVVVSSGPDSSTVSMSTPPAPSTALADAGPAPETALPPAGVIPVKLATADTASEDSGSVQTLLMVIAGALALAGITASIIYRFGAHYRARQAFQGRRHVNWEPVGDTDTAPWTTHAETSQAETWGAEPLQTENSRAEAWQTEAWQAEHDWSGGEEAAPARKIDQPTDAEVGRITELLEQLIRQGPKLDRTTSANGLANSEQRRRA
jgi:hypothetical protein